MNTEKKVLITGASGFLGRNLLEKLKDDGRYRVVALSSRPEQLRESIADGNIECRGKDAVFGEEARGFLRGVYVINCAFPRNSSGSAMADGLRYIQRLFEASVENGAAAIVNISSQSVYSQQRTEPASEKTPPCPETPYAVGKYATELMLESVCRKSATAFTNIRMASLIGPGFDQRIVNRFVESALREGVIRVNRSERRFGFLDVEDAAAGILSLLSAERSGWAEVYNLGSGKSYSLCEMAECVRDVLTAEGERALQMLVTQTEETGSTALDVSLLAEMTGFCAQLSLADSVERIYKAARVLL